MKRKIVLFATIILATLILFGSCSKDDDVTSPTTYTFIYSAETLSSSLTTNVTLFEYNSNGEVIAANTVSNCKKGTTQTFKASNKTVKVKVFIQIKATSSSNVLESDWMNNVFYLTAGQNTNIELNDHTFVTYLEP